MHSKSCISSSIMLFFYSRRWDEIRGNWNRMKGSLTTRALHYASLNITFTWIYAMNIFYLIEQCNWIRDISLELIITCYTIYLCLFMKWEGNSFLKKILDLISNAEGIMEKFFFLSPRYRRSERRHHHHHHWHHEEHRF